MAISHKICPTTQRAPGSLIPGLFVLFYSEIKKLPADGQAIRF